MCQKVNTKLLENDSFQSIPNLKWSIFDNFKRANLQFAPNLTGQNVIFSENYKSFCVGKLKSSQKWIWFFKKFHLYSSKGSAFTFDVLPLTKVHQPSDNVSKQSSSPNPHLDSIRSNDSDKTIGSGENFPLLIQDAQN